MKEINVWDEIIKGEQAWDELEKRCAKMREKLMKELAQSGQDPH